MKGNLLLFLPFVLPIISGLIIGLNKAMEDKKKRDCLTAITLGINLLVAVIICFQKENELVLWQLTQSLSVHFKLDELGKIFILLVNFMWLACGIYAFEYMKHEQKNPRYFAFYLASLGVLNAICLAGNLMTLYMFYEAMTLLTLPLVLHTMKKEAVAAGIKYLVYSVFGASFGLLGMFFLYHYCGHLDFIPGGSLIMEKVQGNETFLLTIVFLAIVGFSTKAGMFPLHGWLPSAHPVAPAPASAVLSGVITKMGVLGVIRVVFYMVGTDFLIGTWVQTTWSTLALITVFMGSMLAFQEKGFKKRLAYSTVSQVSYILFGLSTMTVYGFVGALLHIIVHSAIKNTLFMSAGTVIYKTGKTRVSDLLGMGKFLPYTFIAFTIVSLGLIGIPPTGGFVSKWYLANGSLQVATQYGWVGPAVLLISAILTAAYLLSITIHAFFQPKEEQASEALEAQTPNHANALMLTPMYVLCFVTLFVGMFPSVLLPFFEKIAQLLM